MAMNRHLRAIFAASLLLTSLQPPGALAEPIFRHNLHGTAGVNPVPPPPVPPPGQSVYLAYPAALGTLVSGTPVSTAEGMPALAGMVPGLISFSLGSGSLPSGLVLDPASGIISGVPTWAGNYACKVVAVDSAGNSASAAIASVTAGSIAYSMPASGTTGQRFAAAAPSTLGFGTPAAFSASGALPPGLAIDPSTGAISGTPSAAGTFSFSVQGTDGAGRTGMSPSYTVAIAAPVGLAYPSALATMTDGTAVAPASGTPAVSGLAAPLAYGTAGPLPAGVTVNASTGKLFHFSTRPG